jgi:LysR family nitrogen assimilation transcriptional regulator
MDYRQIQYFVCLYEEGSATRAAQRMNIVQPALSMQIARLEEEMGRQLFVRSSKGMVPTAHATQMYSTFAPLLASFERARADLLGADQELAGHARLGLPASVAKDVLADAVSEFSARHPRVTVSVTEAYTEALVEAVRAGVLDAAIVNKPAKLVLRCDPVLDEQFVLAVATGFPALPTRVPLRQAAKLRLVLPTRAHGLRITLDKLAETAGTPLHCAAEIDSLNAMLQLVERGDFAAILPRSAVRLQLAQQSLRIHEVVRPVLVRHLVCVSHPRRPMPAAAARLVEVLVRHVRQREHVPVQGRVAQRQALSPAA